MLPRRAFVARRIAVLGATRGLAPGCWGPRGASAWGSGRSPDGRSTSRGVGRSPIGNGAHLRAPPAGSGAAGSPRSVGVGFGAQPRRKKHEPGCGAEPHRKRRAPARPRGAARGIGPPRATEPGCGAEPPTRNAAYVCGSRRGQTRGTEPGRLAVSPPGVQHRVAHGGAHRDRRGVPDDDRGGYQRQRCAPARGAPVHVGERAACDQSDTESVGHPRSDVDPGCRHPRDPSPRHAARRRLPRPHRRRRNQIR